MVAVVWGSFVCSALFVYATKARCGKSEKCRQAWKDIVDAPDWQSRIGTAILQSPLLLMMSIKSLALAFGSLVITMVGYVCDIQPWAWLTKWLDRGLEWLFGPGDTPPISPG